MLITPERESLFHSNAHTKRQKQHRLQPGLTGGESALARAAPVGRRYASRWCGSACGRAAPVGADVVAVVVVGAPSRVGQVAGHHLAGDVEAGTEGRVRLVNEAHRLALVVPPATELPGREAAGAHVSAPPSWVGGAVAGCGRRERRRCARPSGSLRASLQIVGARARRASGALSAMSATSASAAHGPNLAKQVPFP